MPLHRFRIRTLMIAVAVVGIGVGGITLYQKSIRRQRLAKQYRSLEATFKAEAAAAHTAVLQSEADLKQSEAKRDSVDPQLAFALKIPGLAATAKRAEAARKTRAAELVKSSRSLVEAARQRENVAQRGLAKFTTLTRKYERAARRPWLPVSPDPPPE